MISAIVTVPPYAPFIREVARHDFVSGLRLNTANDVKKSEPLEDLLNRWRDDSNGKQIWIDLKAKQIRVENYATTPFTKVKISHKIDVEVPVTAYFGNGREHATIVAVDNDELYFLEGPKRVVGPGESINIPNSSLVVHGYLLTKKDLEFISAARNVGIHNYMLSFVECGEDVEELRKHDKDANIVAKIESVKGIEYVKECVRKTRLMAARGDLYMEVNRPHEILNAIKTIIEKDPDAIAASRIFSSLANGSEPSCEDITDVAYLMKIGYKTFMLGDDVCLKRESIIGALNLLEAIVESECSKF